LAELRKRPLFFTFPFKCKDVRVDILVYYNDPKVVKLLEKGFKEPIFYIAGIKYGGKLLHRSPRPLI
jgi:hypothetical protein